MYINFKPFYIIIIDVIQMTDRAGNGRSDDSKNLKWEVCRYMLEDPTAQLQPPLPYISGPAGKSGYRGFHHPVTARLLCPQTKLHEFDDNAE